MRLGVFRGSFRTDGTSVACPGTLDQYLRFEVGGRLDCLTGNLL